MKKVVGCFVLLVLAVGILTVIFTQVWSPFNFGNADGTGRIVIKTEGSPDKAMMQDIQQLADVFDTLTDEMIGVHLRRDIKVYVGADETAYQNILEREFSLKTDDAQKIARVSGGWTGGRRAVTALNGKAGVMADRSDCISTMAHELFHQLQYELSNGNDTDEKVLFWLEEGSADYVGALLAERLGGRSVQKWILDVQIELMSASHTVTLEQLQHTNMAERKALMSKELHTYQMADLMTWHLLTTHGKGQESIKLTEYFRQLKATSDGAEAFENTFGVGLKEYLAEFADWWRAEQQKPAEILIEPRPGVSAEKAQAMQAQVAAVQELFLYRLDRQLHGRYQLILSPNRQDLVNAIQLYCGVTEQKAAELAGSSLWIENNSTILINMEQLSEPHQQIFTMGVLLMRVMQGQRMASVKNDIEWLARGAGYMMGVARMSETGYGSLAQYQHTWSEMLHKSACIPMLSSMKTVEGYQKVSESVSENTASLMTEYAAAELVNRYGWKSLGKWQDTARSTGDAKQAFRQVFGQSVEDFESIVQQKVQHLVMYTR